MPLYQPFRGPVDPGKRGHYLLKTKGNQPHLLRVLESWFAHSSAYTQQHMSKARMTEKGHGRLVAYHIRTTADLNHYLQEEYGWPDVGRRSGLSAPV